jgi:hypothetical protein
MSDPVEIPLDEDDRLADPPLLDLFRVDLESDCYIATFVPSDDVSAEPTLSVSIRQQSVEGRRIAILLARIETICGGRLLLASHLGGGNYTLRLTDGRTTALDALDNASAVELFDRLKQVAVDAEMSYRINHAHAQRWRPAV